MAKTSMKIKQQRPAKFSTREYNRCRICGRPHAYLRKYGICKSKLVNPGYFLKESGSLRSLSPRKGERACLRAGA